VIDPYLGSGTTILAAERTGRRCHAIEIDSNQAMGATDQARSQRH
jgi:DNA modification methylase